MNGRRLGKLISRRLRQVSDSTDISIERIHSPGEVRSKVDRNFFQKFRFKTLEEFARKMNKYKFKCSCHFIILYMRSCNCLATQPWCWWVGPPPYIFVSLCLPSFFSQPWPCSPLWVSITLCHLPVPPFFLAEVVAWGFTGF